MPQFVIFEAPSALGLRATGVERLPEALKAAGLQEGLQAHYAGRVDPLPSTPHRDSTTHLLNGDEIRVYSQHLADTLVPLLHQQLFPVVLGGDCSILIGATLALRRLGRYGLFFVDGHTDFYQPEAEPSGEVASMDLALISGRGPTLLSDIDGLRPLVRDEDVVAFGSRDAEQVARTAVKTFESLPLWCTIWQTSVHIHFPLQRHRVSIICSRMIWRGYGSMWMPTCSTMRLCLL